MLPTACFSLTVQDVERRFSRMKKPTDNPADPFKKALAEATKVMANDPELAVTFTVDPPGATRETVRLPQVSRRNR